MENNRLLYKYLELNEDSLSIIDKGTLKFSHVESFNDPFDCNPEFDARNYAKCLVEHIDSYNKNKEKNLSPAQRMQQKIREIQRFEQEIRKPGFGIQVTNSYGVFCLSKDPLSVLMWSHYADHHKGFVVEFSIPNYPQVDTIEEAREFTLNNLVPFEVYYNKEKPIIDSNHDLNENLKQTLFVKGLSWEYENEERIIDYLNGPGIYKYDQKRYLKSVIAGARMDENDFNNLKSKINNLNKKLSVNVTLYKAQLTPKKFELHVPRRPDLSVLHKNLIKQKKRP